MSRVNDCEKAAGVIRTFDFNGFVVEVISRRGRVANQLKNKENCAICSNVIDPHDVVVLPCQDAFCRRCIAQAFIDNDEETMTCPSKHTKCDNEIATTEIEGILGEENFKLFRLDRLERRLESLMSQTQSKKRSGLSTEKDFSTNPSQAAQCFVDSQRVRPLNLVNDSTGQSQYLFKDVSAESEMASNNIENMNTQSTSEPDFDSTDGAAGLWARSIHSSFVDYSTGPAVRSRGSFPLQGQESSFSQDKHSFRASHANSLATSPYTPPVLRNREHSFNSQFTLPASPNAYDLNPGRSASATSFSASVEAQARFVREERAQNWQMMSPQRVKQEPVSPRHIKNEKLSPVLGEMRSGLNLENYRERRNAAGLQTNTEEFVCSICLMFVFEEQGLTLRKCNHSFCRPCVFEVIMNRKSRTITCPMTAIRCDQTLFHEEILALVGPQTYAFFVDVEQQPADPLNSITIPHLLELENYDYVENQSVFNCAICLTDVEPGSGIILKNCLHEYCKGCLGRHIESSDDLEVPCPYVAEGGTRCEGYLQDRELRSLVDERVYAAHLVKSIERAEASIKNSFHCKTPDCRGWAEIGDLVTDFRCPVCDKVNCVKCKVIHEGKTCMEYYYDTNEGARKVRDDNETEKQLQSLINTKQAMNCPGCGVVIEKNRGCNHMTCSRCKREFQWLGLP